MKRKDMQIWRIVITLIVLTLTAACTPGAGTDVNPDTENKAITISGQIVTADNTGETLLPEGNEIIVQVQDTSRADAPAIVLGEQIITGAASLPASYQIRVNQADLENAVQASLAVRIEDTEGQLLYINDTMHLVSVNEKAMDIAVIAVGNGGVSSSLPPAFDGQVWQWVAFQDSADGEESNDILVDDPSQYTLELLADGTYAIQADCNFANGQFTLDEGGLTLSPGAMTLAACGPESLSQRFVELLGDVVTFVFNAEGNLVLNLKIDAGDMIFVRAQPEGTSPQQTGSTLLESQDQWRGIGRINLSSTCTAVLVDTGAGETAPAYILTNGHCVEWLANGAITNQKVEGEVLFNYFVDTADAPIAIPLAEIVYSTMQGMDIAIIRLDATLGELAAKKIFPYPIAEVPLDRESRVRVVGAPSSGVMPEEAYLREEICQTKGQVDLLEFNWHFYDHYATSCQDIFGGSSGSPLFAAETNTVFGLVNTTVDGSSACYLGVPCEIGDGQVTVNQNTSYAAPLHGLSACFGEDGIFALSPDCPLPPTAQLTFAETPPLSSQPPLTWSTTLAGDLPYYRYKTGAAGVVDCRSTEGYSSILSLAGHPTIDDAIPDEEGFYLLCVLAGESAALDDTWQHPAYPTVASTQIDTTPPQMEPQLSIREMPEFFDVTLVFDPPELSDYLFKFGPKEDIDCAVQADYARYRRIPLTLERGGGAIRLCVIGFDNANNATEPLDRVFDE